MFLNVVYRDIRADAGPQERITKVVELGRVCLSFSLPISHFPFPFPSLLPRNTNTDEHNNADCDALWVDTADHLHRVYEEYASAYVHQVRFLYSSVILPVYL